MILSSGLRPRPAHFLPLQQLQVMPKLFLFSLRFPPVCEAEKRGGGGGASFRSSKVHRETVSRVSARRDVTSTGSGEAQQSLFSFLAQHTHTTYCLNSQLHEILLILSSLTSKTKFLQIPNYVPLSCPPSKTRPMGSSATTLIPKGPGSPPCHQPTDATLLDLSQLPTTTIDSSYFLLSIPSRPLPYLTNLN